MSIRAMARRAAEQAIWQVATERGGQDGIRRVRILGGPLRGAHLALPALERPSMVLGTYERAVSTTLRRHARPGDVAYDIGAHAGYLTLLLARAVGPRGAVVAVEANPRNGVALERTIALNGLASVRVVHEAVSAQVGTVRFAAFDYSTVGHIATAATPADAALLDIPCTTLDALVYDRGFPRPALMKIDVEGAEALVIRGALRVLREGRPAIVVEARDTPEWARLRADLALMGYTETVIHAWEPGLADVLLCARR